MKILMKQKIKIQKKKIFLKIKNKFNQIFINNLTIQINFNKFKNHKSKIKLINIMNNIIMI